MSFRISLAALSLIFFAAGCSLWGGPDQSVLDQTNYRPINGECSKIDLKTSHIDVKTFRATIQCLNTYGAIQEFVDLFEKLSDKRLQPLVEVLNTHFLNDQVLLYHLKKTHQTLVNRGIADSVFKKLGEFLKNEDFIASGIALFKESYFIKNQAQEPVQNQEILKVIEMAGNAIEPTSVSKALEFGIKVLGHRAYQDLLRDFKKVKDSGPTLEDLTARIHQYVQLHFLNASKISESSPLVAWLRRPENHFFTLIDEIFGKDEALNKQKIPLQSALMTALFQPDQDHPGQTQFESLSDVFYRLKQPGVQIHCVNETQRIDDVNLYLMQQIGELPKGSSAANYVLRQGPLTLLALSPFCSAFPVELTESFPVLGGFAKLRIVDSSAQAGAPFLSVMQPLAEMIQTFWKQSVTGDSGQSSFGDKSYPWIHLLIQTLTDREANGGGILGLIPVFQELTERKIWTDLFLVFTLGDADDRKWIEELVKFFIQSLPESPLRTVSDVLMHAVSQTDIKHLFTFVMSLQRYIDLKDDFLKESLVTLRQAYLANNVHPILSLAQSLMSHATERGELFHTFFEISEMPEFKLAVRKMSILAQNGQMNELVGAILGLCDHFISEGERKSIRIKELHPPDLILKTQHSLTHDGLPTYEIASAEAEDYKVDGNCGLLNLKLSLDPLASPADYEKRLDEFLACLGSDSTHTHLIRDLSFLIKNAKTDETPPQDFFKYQLKIFKDFFSDPNSPERSFQREEIQYLTDAWIHSFDQNRFKDILKGFSYWMEGSTQAPPLPTPFLEPLFQVVSHLMQSESRVDLRELQNYGAEVIRSEEFPKLLADLDDLSGTSYPFEAPLGGYDFTKHRDQIQLWVEHKECSTDPTDVNRVIEEARNALTDHELVLDPVSHTKASRQSWQIDDLKPWINPILERMHQSSGSDLDRSLIEGITDFFRFYSLEPGQPFTAQAHGTPKDLAVWLHAVSIDYEPIFVFKGLYPKVPADQLEELPHVVLDNLLGRLAKISWASHFTSPSYSDLVLDFWQELGEAWGDLPEELWPQEIKQGVSGKSIRTETDSVTLKSRPLKLLEAVEDILNRRWSFNIPSLTANLDYLTDMIGLPALPDCYRPVPDFPDPPANKGWPKVAGIIVGRQRKEIQQRLWNMHQTKESMRSAAKPGTLGEPPKLAVFRDLFFSIYYSTPKNNLNALANAVGMGAMKALSQVGRSIDPNDKEVVDFFNALVHLGGSVETQKLMTVLVTAPSMAEPHFELFWNVLKQVFDQMGSNGTPESLWRLKQLSFYSLASFNQMGSDDSVLELGVGRLSQVLEENRPFFTQNADLLKDLFSSSAVPAFFRTLYENPDEERRKRIGTFIRKFLLDQSGRPGSHRLKNGVEILKNIYEVDEVKQAFREFQSRIELLMKDPDYLEFKPKWYAALRPILRLLEERPDEPGRVLSPVETPLAKKIRLFGSHLLSEGSVDQWLSLMGRNPVAFNQLLETFSRYGVSEDFENFLKIVRRSLSETQH